MTGTEMRAIRKEIALTQYELAERLSVSRKTVVGWEASHEQLDEGVVLQLLNLAGKIRVIENTFWVEPTIEGSYAVVRRRIRNLPTTRAASFTHGELTLYGIFKRRDHAYRWCTALQNTADPRSSRKLKKERALEMAI
jgi:DNA-binding XRE family transcriptional regulator